MSARLWASLGAMTVATLVSACHTPVASGRIETNRPYKVAVNGQVQMSQTVSLGETPQHIDIRGLSEDQPVLLYLHGGPGRAGGGEELGGLRGLEFYTQRVAIQGDSGVLGKVLGIPAE